MRTFVALIAGLLSGFLVAELLRPPGDGGGPQAASPAGRGSAGPGAANVAGERRTPLEVPRNAAEPALESEERVEVIVEDELIGPALWSYAEAGLRTGWSSVRPDPIPMERMEQGTAEFEETVLAAPELIGRAMGENETAKEAALEDARTGGAMALLASLMEGAGPVPALVNDPGAFEELFRRDSPERAQAVGPSLRDLGSSAEEGTTFAFPVGVFEMGDILSEQTPFPRDVTIAGAGMDSTLIVLRSDLGARGTLRRFAVRDCTIFTNSNYFFDHRRGAATVLMDRVRVIGFDMAAGSSCAVSFDEGIAMYARDCRFEGGYGRRPGSGRLMDLRHPAVVVRFENCRVSAVRVDVQRLVDGATVVFSNCQLFDIVNDVQAEAEGRPGILFPGTVIHRRDLDEGPLPALDLDQLFPDWKQRMER